MPAPTSPMGGLMLGLGSGRRKYEERQAGQLKAAQDAASFGLKLGTEQRLTTAAGEKQAANIMARIAAPDYTPSEAPYLVSAAKDWDGAYGKLFPNTELTKRVTQMLNLDPQAPSRPSRAASGFESTPRAASDAHFMPSRSSEIAGWADPVKKILYDTKLSSAAKDLKFQLQGGQLMQSALDYVMERTGGAVTNAASPLALLEWESAMREGSDMPQDEIAKISERVMSRIGDAREAEAKTAGRHDSFMQNVAVNTDRLTKYVDRMLGDEFDGLGGVLRIMDGYQNLRMQMHEYGAAAIASGLNYGTVVTRISQMFTDKDGNLPKNPLDSDAPPIRVTPWFKQLGQSPDWFAGAVQGFYNAGADPFRWIPAWDVDVKEGTMWDSVNDVYEPVTQPTSPATPIPAGAQPRPALPGEDTRPLRGERTGTGPANEPPGRLDKILKGTGEVGKYHPAAAAIRGILGG